MSAAIDYSYHAVGETSKGHRIWIENLMLERNGFTAGAIYTRRISSDRKIIVLELIDNPEQTAAQETFTVSKTASGTPIVYIRNKTISAIFGGHERVVVEYKQGVIEISLHNVCKLSAERVKRFRENLNKGELTEGTFCAGVGMSTLGIHEGFKKHGISIKTSWVLDREQRFLDAAIKNNPAVTRETSVINGKMEELDTRKLTPVDIFQFSMSCRVYTKASLAKKKRSVAENHEDAAGVYGIFKSLEPINPAVIVSENVREAKGSATYIILKAVLQELGYNVYEFTLDNEQSGSFENRPRYWFVAIDKNLPEIIPEAIPAYTRQYSTFADVMNAAPANDTAYEWRTPTQARVEKILRDKEKGNGFSNQPMLYPHSTSAPTVRREYLKNGSTDVQIAGDGGTYRMLTPEEHCVMKSAPLSLIAGLTKTLAHEVLGQGVDMGQSIGLAELVCLCVTGQVKRTAVELKPEQQNLF